MESAKDTELAIDTEPAIDEMSAPGKIAEGIRLALPLRPIDDACGTVFFEDIECVQMLLREILGKPNIHILESNVQRTLENIYGKGARLDVLAFDKFNAYNIEFQTTRHGIEPSRALSNYRAIAQHLIAKGTEFKDFPLINVVFVQDKDYLKTDLPVAKVLHTIEAKDGPKPIELKLEIYYANACYQDKNTMLGRLMHDMFYAKSEDMWTPEFSKRMAQVKDLNGKEIIRMGKIIMGYYEKGIQQGRIEMKFESALAFLNAGVPLSKVSKVLNLSPDQQKQLNAMRKSPAPTV